MLSVTVIADNCTHADALATAFMVMGLDASMQFLDKHPHYAAYFIYDDKGKFKQKKQLTFPKKANNRCRAIKCRFKSTPKAESKSFTVT